MKRPFNEITMGKKSSDLDKLQFDKDKTTKISQNHNKDKDTNSISNSNSNNMTINDQVIEVGMPDPNDLFIDDINAIFEEAHSNYLSSGTNVFMTLEQSATELFSLRSELESFTQDIFDSVQAEEADLLSFHTRMKRCLSVFSLEGFESFKSHGEGEGEEEDQEIKGVSPTRPSKK